MLCVCGGEVYSKGKCSKCYQHEWYLSHRNTQIIDAKRRYALDKEESAARKRQYNRNLKIKVIAGYGGKCVCCGEIRLEFLGVDHINGGGKAHRAIVGKGGPEFNRWIIKNNFPTDLQILCHNCNLAKGFYGQCPHEKDREMASKDISEYYKQLAGWRS